MEIIELDRLDASEPMSRLLADNINPSALLSVASLEYRKAYLGTRFRGRHVAFVDDKGKAICGTIFDLIADDRGEIVLDAATAPSALIWATGTPVIERSIAEDLLIEHIALLGKRYGATRLSFRDQLVDGVASSLSLWAQERNASETGEWWQVIDLAESDVALWAALRKSYKSCVNQGRRKMAVRVSRDRESFDALRRLHFEAAGGATRSSESWDLQWKMLENAEAFLTTAAINGDIVSASFFMTTRYDCYYGVGAADRSHFDKPLNHAPMWEAIRYAKELGCLRFQTGAQVWESDGATRKEAAIAEFKRGFGGVPLPEIVLTLKLDSESRATGME
jgi:hypothetical protein